MKHTLLTYCTSLLVVLFLAGATGLSAATLTVTSTVDGDPGSLSDVLAASTNGDVIVFDAATDGVPQTINTLIVVANKTITINGNGIDVTIIEGGNADGILQIEDSNIGMRDLTIQGARTTTNQHGALLISGSTVNFTAVRFFDNQVTNPVANTINGGGAFATGGNISTISINECVFEQNRGIGISSGGAIYNPSAVITINGGSFIGNGSDLFGGAIVSGNPGTGLILRGVSFSGNEALATGGAGDGGALWLFGSPNTIIQGCTFQGNNAARSGGAVWSSDAAMTVDNTVFNFNIASGAAATDGGGGLYSVAGPVVVRGSTFTSNIADGASGSGGAVWNGTGTMTVSNSGFTTNVSSRAGGAIENNGGDGSRLTLNNVNMSTNATGPSPGNGGGLHVTGGGRVIVNGGTYMANTASSEGGGLWNGSGLMVVRDAMIGGNTASGDAGDNGGGGIFNAGGTMRILRTSIMDNDAPGASGSGGGLFNDAGGAIKLFDSSISGNSASRAGGGIEDNSGAGTKVNLQRCALNFNTTGSAPGNGGGLHVTGPGEVVFNDGEVLGNSAAAEGGGLWNGSGTMTVTNSTIDDNTAGGDASDQGGGGIFNAGGSVSVSNTTLTNNTATGMAGNGGGIMNDAGGTVKALGVTITRCSAVRAGGGIESNGGELYFFRGEIAECNAGNAPGNGGGIHSTGFSQIIDSELHFNDAIQGGGAWNGSGGRMEILTSTVDFNELADVPGTLGGGLYNQSGEMIVTMSTIAENSADIGGAIAVENGLLDLQSVTIARNRVNDTNTAGGIAIASGTVVIANTVIALNEVIGTGLPYDVSGQGTFQSKGYNFIGADDDGGLIAATADPDDQFGTQAAPLDPNLGFLADNGGFTLTMETLCPSPLIDLGNPGYNDDDQRDQPVFNGRKDIGAYEAQFACAEPFVGNDQLETTVATFESSVYPNPVTAGRATVIVPASFGEEAVTLRVTDMSGTLLFERQTYVGTEELNLGNLPNGTYTLQLISDTTVESHRVIVSR